MATAFLSDTRGMGFMQPTSHSYIEQGMQCLDKIFNAFWAKLQARIQQPQQKPITVERSDVVPKKGEPTVGKDSPTHTPAKNRHQMLRVSHKTTFEHSGRKPPARAGTYHQAPPATPVGSKTLALTQAWRWREHLSRR
ncbi:Hypothetical predicted protein [Pelobates cultripes]|uniref:Uncharacterized protein n=1 Tax=Pelobates cultripes TaxID=61616 RepID=A0AAD1TB74_PELCU|nr:Hypothetical predicted protein [Pelobates cultripes]